MHHSPNKLESEHGHVMHSSLKELLKIYTIYTKSKDPKKNLNGNLKLNFNNFKNYLYLTKDS